METQNICLIDLMNYLERILEPTKSVRHSIFTNNDLALEVIQNANWQYFIETTLTACKANNAGINNIIDLKNINLMKLILIYKEIIILLIYAK